MRFWKTLPGALFLFLAFSLGVCAGALLIRVHHATHPSRRVDPSLDLASTLVRFDEARFTAADGVNLAGWLLRGSGSRPAVVLCHDYGSSRASMLNLAIPLQQAGFTVLAFDFRGHGHSGGSSSSLGLAEKRDVLGAVDYLSTVAGLDVRRVGIYGVGMGAYAATLAAADRPTLRVLVLDSLYPDAEYPLVRRAYENWSFGVKHLGFLARAAFSLLHSNAGSGPRAADIVPLLQGRDLLMVAPASDAALAEQIERMYRSIPEQENVDGNLVTLPATPATGLYGENLDRYLERVCAFFESRLPRR